LEEKITIGKEKRVENPARPGAKPVAKNTKDARRLDNQHAKQKTAQLWL
jgi:hypothetical protein